jgi:hypothetical protein
MIIKKILSVIWHYWKKIGVAVGNIVSTVILTIFYFTIFPLFAIPVKLISQPLKRKSENSNYMIKEKTLSALKDFESES